MQRDVITIRQYALTIFVAIFSPVSRLLPKAVVEVAGISGWVAPLLAFFPLLGLIWVVEKLLTVDGVKHSLAAALRLRLGNGPGKIICLFYGLWITVYGGFLLRSGGERLVSTIYPTAHLPLFLVAMLVPVVIAAMGPLRYAVRSAVVLMLLFVCALIAVNLLAVPNIKLQYLLPVNVLKPGRLLLSAVPVVNVLSSWVNFSFLRDRVVEDGNVMRRSAGYLVLLILMVILLLVTTVGILGPELCLRHQFPFFIMIKNLTFFNVIERIEPVVVMIWLLTDYVCITMQLISAGEALRNVFEIGKRAHYIFPISFAMLAVSFVIAKDAFRFMRVSNVVIPIINLCIVFILLPLFLVLSVFRKKLRKIKKRC